MVYGPPTGVPACSLPLDRLVWVHISLLSYTVAPSFRTRTMMLSSLQSQDPRQPGRINSAAPLLVSSRPLYDCNFNTGKSSSAGWGPVSGGVGEGGLEKPCLLFVGHLAVPTSQMRAHNRHLPGHLPRRRPHRWSTWGRTPVQRCGSGRASPGWPGH